MKLKYILLTFLSSLLYLCCSKNEPEPFDLYGPILGDLNLHALFIYDNIYDDCNCPLDYYMDCGTIFFMSQEESERLMEIIEQSQDSCVYISGVENGGDTFEGFYKK